MHETYEDSLNGEPEGVLVHWMDRPRHHLSTTALVSVLTGTFLVGAGVGIAMAMLSGRVNPPDAPRAVAQTASNTAEARSIAHAMATPPP